MRAIWYRQWLELRSGFYVSVVFVALMVLVYAVAVDGITSYYDETGRYAKEVVKLEPIVRSAPERLIPWAVHAHFATLLALMAPLMLHGSGYASQQRRGLVNSRHPSAQFTLSLPIPRYLMVGTRLAAGVAALAGLLALSLVGDLAALLVLGRPIALGPMMVTTLLASVVGAAVITTLSLLTLLVQGSWVGLAMVPVQLLLWFVGWSYTMDFLGGIAPRLTIVSALFGTVAVATGFTVIAAGRKEF